MAAYFLKKCSNEWNSPKTFHRHYNALVLKEELPLFNFNGTELASIVLQTRQAIQVGYLWFSSVIDYEHLKFRLI